MKKNKSIASGGTLIIQASRTRQRIQKVALFLAVFIGALVIYFCLMPALADDGAKYIYFDNGLSMYDEVEYSLDGVEYKKMIPLTDGDAHQPQDDGITNMSHINKDYTYVTQEAVAVDQSIYFRGTASGRVYDSMSNYQISSASRDWGYDYKNFVWESGALSLNDGTGWNCYYAPALAMQYKYNAVNSEGKLVDFIKNYGWGVQGDPKPRRVMPIEIPENMNAFTSGVLFSDNVTEFGILGASDAVISYEKNEYALSRRIAVPTAESTEPETDISAEMTEDSSGTEFLEEETAAAEESAEEMLPQSEETSDGTEITEETFDETGMTEEETTESETSEEETTETAEPAAVMEPDGSSNMKLTTSGTASAYKNAIRINSSEPAELTVYAGAVGADTQLWLLSSTGNQIETGWETLTEQAAAYTYQIEAGTYYIGGSDAVSIYSVAVGGSALENVISADSAVRMVSVEQDTISGATAYMYTDDLGTKYTYFADNIKDSDNGLMLSTNGAASASGNAVKIETVNAGVLLVYADISQTAGKHLVLLDAEGNTLKSYKLSAEKDNYAINVSANTTYYLGGDDSINIYAVEGDYEEVGTSEGAARAFRFNFTTANLSGDVTKASNRYANSAGSIVSSSSGIVVGDPNDPDSYYQVSMRASESNKMTHSTNRSYKGVDGMDFSRYLNTSGGMNATKWGDGSDPSQSIRITLPKGKSGFVRVYATSGSTSAVRSVGLYYDSYEPIAQEALVLDNTKPVAVDLEFTKGDGNYYIASTSGGIFIFAVEMYFYNDGAGVRDTTTIYPDNAINRTFEDYHYAMNGITGMVDDVNRIGLNAVQAGADGSYALGNGDMGTGSADVYSTKATIYDYFSDWELAGNALNSHQNVYENSVVAKETRSSGVTNLITFAEGTNTASYVYQGDLWNQAIRDYYNIEKGITGRELLYFGSNSWFTGNERYDSGVDGYNAKIPDNIPENGSRASGGNWVYNIPTVREYLKNFLPIQNEAHGMSLSRAYPGLVDDVEYLRTENGEDYTYIKLNGIDAEVPYFNQKFLEGDNTKNAVYGKVYEDVKFDFKLNESNGYYEYNSEMAEYATRLTKNQKVTNRDDYYLAYTGKGVPKADANKATYQFYPFNDRNAADTDTGYYFCNENLMFGMKLSIPLVTYTNSTYRNGIFRFAGDDDVWIYVSRVVTDGETGREEVQSRLALDVGGTHAALGGVIDMRTGYAARLSEYREGTGITTGNADGTGTTAKIDDDKERPAFAFATVDGIINSADPDLNGTASSSYENIKYENGAATVQSGGVTISYLGVDYKFSAGDSCKTVIDDDNKLYKVTLKRNGVIEEYAFSLVNVSECLPEDKNASSSETSNLQLNIYYMERGLNSSNLKLSFKFVDVTNRKVEKQWADEIAGFNTHTDEKIGVRLYREGATEKATQLDSYAVSDFMTIRTNAYNRNGAESDSGFVNNDDMVSVRMKTDANTKSMAMSINGFQLTRTAFEALQGDLSLQMLINGEETTPPWDSSGKYLAGLNPEDEITLKFKAVSSAGNMIVDTSAYLVEFYPSSEAEFRSDMPSAVEEISLTADTKKIHRIIAETIQQHEDGSKFSPHDVYAYDMRFVIVERMASASAYEYMTSAVYKNDQLSVRATVHEDGRYIFYLRNVWKGAFGGITRLTDSNCASYRTSDTTFGGQEKPFEKVMKKIEDTDNYFISLSVNTSDTKVTSGIKDWEPALTGYYYPTEMEIVQIGDEVILSQANYWEHEWEKLTESANLNGELVPYIYYISAEDISEEYGKFIKIYYAMNNDQREMLYPIEREINGQTVILYPISKALHVLISNTPSADLALLKNWYPEKPADAEGIVVSIYRSVQKSDTETAVQYEFYKTVTLDEANGWSTELQDVPYFDNLTGEKYEYFAVEKNPHDNYSPVYSVLDRIEIMENGEKIYLYPLSKTDEGKSLNMTITNKEVDEQEYSLKVLKTDAETGEIKLQGAQFKLSVLDDETGIFNEIATDLSTDENGLIVFVGDSTGDPITFELGRTYQLSEITAPDGYVRGEQKEITFIVTKNESGELELSTPPEDGSLYKSYEIRDNCILILTLTNGVYHINMPSTGGGSIIWVVIGGVGMMIVSLILVFRTGKKQRRD